MSLSEQLIHRSYIKVTICYNNRTLCTEIPPYLPISKIREDAIIFFSPEVSKLSLYYNKLSLSSYEHWAIGDYFKDKHSITLRFQSNDDIYNTIDCNRIFPTKLHHNCVNPSFDDYCCYCKEFFCSNCSNALLHSNHLTIKKTTWLNEDGLKQYAKRIQNDIEMNINATKECYMKYKDEKNYYNLLNRREAIVQKLEKVHAIFLKMIKVLQFELEKPAEVEMYMRDIDQKGKSSIDCIEDIMTKMTIDLNNINANAKTDNYYNTLPELISNAILDKYKTVFDILNQKEKEFYITPINGQIFRTTYQLNTKMNVIWDQLEHILDGALIIDRPLTIDNSTYSTYLMLLQHNQKLATIGSINANSTSHYMSYSKNYTPLKPLLVVTNYNNKKKYFSNTATMRKNANINYSRDNPQPTFSSMNNSHRRNTKNSINSKSVKHIRIQVDANKPYLPERKRLRMPLHCEDDEDGILEFNKIELL